MTFHGSGQAFVGLFGVACDAMPHGLGSAPVSAAVDAGVTDGGISGAGVSEAGAPGAGTFAVPTVTVPLRWTESTAGRPVSLWNEWTVTHSLVDVVNTGRGYIGLIAYGEDGSVIGSLSLAPGESVRSFAVDGAVNYAAANLEVSRESGDGQMTYRAPGEWA